MPPAWTSDWVGIPYVDLGRARDGCDCLGLYILINAIRRGVTIPDPLCSVAGAVRRRVVSEQAKRYSLATEPEEGDAILIRRRGHPLHVGYCVSADLMLHSERGVGSTVEKWTGTKWGNRVVGVYRFNR